MIVPMDKKSADDAVNLILEYAKKDILEATPASGQLVEDFALAARVETTLGKEGHDISVSAGDGRVTLTINRHVLRLSRLEEELKKIVMTVSGVEDVGTKVGPGYYKSDIYRKFDLKQPTKVVLVDDEREYVETLSDRLLMRDMRAAIVYDGKQALSYVDKEEPEVMVLDLKMPGIDGMEVLRGVKKKHPDVEVIVLTGLGSKEDEKTCLELGAFAYLEKPVDVEVLTQTMRKAHKKAREKRLNVSDRKD
jgi:CheY-like chemotaxis protein